MAAETNMIKITTDTSRQIRLSNTACLVAAMMLTASNVSAQSYLTSSSTLSSGPGLPVDTVEKKDTKSEQKADSRKGATVKIKIQDSTVRYILQSLSKLTDVSLVFNSADSRLSKKASIDVNGVSLMEAVQLSLKGTGLNAKRSPDGKTILIGNPDQPRDSRSSDGKGSISGIVLDSVTGEGLDGVSVSVVGLPVVSVSYANGSFSFDSVPLGRQQLIFKRIGYRNTGRFVDIEQGVNRFPNVRLWKTTTALSEVVTTATGQQRRLEVANDIVKIDADKIRERAPVRGIADIIEAAQVPGVVVTRGSGDPGAATKIRIRGLGSISQSNDPVLIVDGIWVDASVRSPSKLDDIDPATIQSIEIVRGPSAATLYGQDAANGVIVVTTKKGTTGSTRFTVSHNRDWGQTYGRLPLSYRGIGHSPITGLQISDCSIAMVVQYVCVQDSVIVTDPNNRLLLREGVENNSKTTLQLEGGRGNILYALTGTYGTTIGVKKMSPIDRIRLRLLGHEIDNAFSRPTGLDRSSISSNLTISPTDQLNIGLALNGARTLLKDNSYNLSQIVTLAPLDTVVFLDDPANPAKRFSTIESPTENTSVSVSSSLTWRVNRFLVTGNAGLDRVMSDASSFTRRINCHPGRACADTVGSRIQENTQTTNYSFRFNVSNQLSLGKFDRFLEIRPTIGGDLRRTINTNLRVQVEDIPPGSNSLQSGTQGNSLYGKIPNATAGWYLNSSIGIFNRVYFDIGIRQDIGSAITSSSGAKYPKIGGSWLVSDEGFWPENRFVDLLRIRAALGYSAVQPDAQDIYGRYRASYAFIDGRFVPSAVLSGGGNPSLLPERAGEFEVGADADLAGDRVRIGFTYAHSENTNTLVQRNLAPSAGTAAVRKENIGRIRNQNIEVTTEARVLETDNLRMALNYNFAMNKNMVVSLGDRGLPYPVTAMGKVAQGYPLASIWVRKVLGYNDDNGDGLLSLDEVVLTDSAHYVGTAQPRLTSSFGINATIFKRFSFDSRFAYQSSYVKQYTHNSGYGSMDVNAPLSEQAVYVINDITGRRPVKDLRWTSASIGYHVPERLIDRLRMSSLVVSLQGSNLGLWTKYEGRDPSVNGSIMTSEISTDNGFLTPRPRLFVLDFRVSFK